MSPKVQDDAPTFHWWTHPKVILFTLFVVAPCAIGIPIAIAQSQQKPNTDPRLGSVQVHTDHSQDDIRKFCDGTTLVYKNDWNGSIAAVSNSPECAR